MFDDDIRYAQIRSEQNKYKPTLTMEEIREMTLENDRKCGRPVLTLEEINQYISEVRNGRK